MKYVVQLPGMEIYISDDQTTRMLADAKKYDTLEEAQLDKTEKGMYDWDIKEYVE